jgi:WD40 repeat protein
MLKTLGICLGALCLFVVFSQTADCEPRAAGKKSRHKEKPGRHDRYGDPLPPGAIARMGTVRFRNWAICLALSPNGKKLVTGSEDGLVRLWDVKTGRNLRSFPDHARILRTVAFSPDGKRLASAGDAESIRLWETATGKQAAILETGQDEVVCLAFSPDGKKLASGSRYRSIRVWDVDTGKKLHRLAGHKEGVNAVSFSPDGTTLASAGNDYGIRFWDVASGKLRGEILQEQGGGRCVAYSSDGKTLATADAGTVRIWNLATLKQIHRLKGHRHIISSLTFSASGKFLHSWSKEEHMIRVWEVATGNELHCPGPRPGGYAAAISLDGKITARADHGRIRLWRTFTGKEIARYRGHTEWVNSIAFSPDSKLLVSTGGDKTIRLWDVVTGKQLRRLREHTKGKGRPWFLPDGKTLAALVEKRNAIMVWNPARGKMTCRLGAKWDKVESLAVSPDGRTIAAGSVGIIGGNHTKVPIHIWNAATGIEIRRFNVDSKGSYSLAFSADGRFLASVGSLIQLFDVVRGKEICRFDKDISGCFPVTMDGDKLVVSVPNGRCIKVWHVATRRLDQMVIPKDGEVVTLDGRTLASVGPGHGTVVLTELASGKERGQFSSGWVSTDHRDEVAFSPNGQLVASGGPDTTILVWDVTGLMNRGRIRRGKLSTGQVSNLWQILGSEEATAAYRAMWTLVASPKETVAILHKRFHPVRSSGITAEQVAQMVSKINKEQTYGETYSELKKLGEAGRPILYRALAEHPDGFGSSGVKQLLETLDGAVDSPDALRALRSIEVLEHIGTRGAKAVLRKISKGAPEARLTQEAKAALHRLIRIQGTKH